MILIDKAKYTVDGVDIYPDHEAPNQFWYVPGTVQLAERGGRKALSYLWYTDGAEDTDGTGFLNFEVNTAVPPATLDKIYGLLSQKTGLKRDAIRLAAVTYTGGAVNFSVLGPVAAQASSAAKGDGVLYQSKEQMVWSAGSSSLVGDNAAVCSVRFNKDGGMAGAMKEAILGGSNAIAAMYRLEFLAMRPSVTFTVRGTLEKTIKDFQMSLGTQIPLEALMLDIGINAQWQRIMQNTDLKIEVVNFSGEESEGLKWAQSMLLDYVVKNFFEVQIGQKEGSWSPVTSAPEVNEAIAKTQAIEQAAEGKVAEEGKTGDEAAGAVKEVVKAATMYIPKVNVRAAYYDGKQVNSIDFVYAESKAKPFVVLPQALVLEGIKDPRTYVSQINRSQDPFGTPYPVLVSIPSGDDLARSGLLAVNVQARYPADSPANKQATATLSVVDGKKTGPNPFPFQYDARGAADVAYSVDYVFKADDSWNAPAAKMSVTGTEPRGLIVAMPDAVVEFLAIDIALQDDFVWDEATQAVVTLTSPKWSGEKRVVFQPGRTSAQRFQIRADAKFRDADVSYRVDLTRNGKPVLSRGPQLVTDKQIVVQDRFVDHVPVFFDALFADGTWDVTLRYQQGDFVWEDQFSLDAGDKRIKRIVPVMQELKRRSDVKVSCEITPADGDPFTLAASGGQTVRVRQRAA